MAPTPPAAGEGDEHLRRNKQVGKPWTVMRLKLDGLPTCVAWLSGLCQAPRIGTIVRPAVPLTAGPSTESAL
jgi:hypothetical protein